MLSAERRWEGNHRGGYWEGNEWVYLDSQSGGERARKRERQRECVCECERERGTGREKEPSQYPSAASLGLTVRLWINDNPQDCQIIGCSLSSKLEDDRYSQVDLPGLWYESVKFEAERVRAHQIGEPR